MGLDRHTLRLGNENILKNPGVEFTMYTEARSSTINLEKICLKEAESESELHPIVTFGNLHWCLMLRSGVKRTLRSYICYNVYHAVLPIKIITKFSTTQTHIWQKIFQIHYNNKKNIIGEIIHKIYVYLWKV